MNGASEFTPTPEVKLELDEDEDELELGLTLGGCGKGPGWGDYCRFLTAKDFPVRGLRASPGSSVSSSSSPAPLTKRAPVEVGASTSPPNQVVVGWPPVRSFRMNTLASSQTCKDSNEEQGSKEQERKPVARGRGRGSASTRFVKVNMDGDPIGRKVDLSAHCSYGTLALALETMFHRPTTASTCGGLGASKLLDGSSEFALTYEDKDGDWMLVGDVPWGMFLDTVRRLRIMRTSDANGLAPRFEPSDETSG